MMNNIVMLITSLIALIMIVYTCYIKILNMIKIIKRKTSKYIKLFKNIKYFRKARKDINIIKTKNYNLHNLLILNTSESRDLALFLLVLPIALFFPQTHELITYTIIVIILIGFLRFFNLSFDKSLFFLCFKWLILYLYILHFFIFFMEDINNLSYMFFILGFVFLYTIILIIRSYKDFANTLIHLINFGLGIITINVVVGIIFGLNYIINSDLNNLFSTQEKELFLGEDEEASHWLFFIMFRGLYYFYNFPNHQIVKLDNVITYLPFLQAIIGFLFNVLIISFLISYFFSLTTSKE